MGTSYRPRRAIADGIGATLNGPVRYAVEEYLLHRRAEEGDKPTAAGTKLRGSMARDCSRRIAFNVLGLEGAAPLSATTLAAFDIGNSWHELIQTAIVAEMETNATIRDVSLERVIDLRPMVDLSGSADAVMRLWDNDRQEEQTVVVEIKSMKNYAWELAVNGNKYDGAGPGPKPEHLTQAGIYAQGVDGDAVHMVYVNKDTADMAEWRIGVDDPLIHFGSGLDTVRDLVNTDLWRMRNILDDLDRGIMPARFIPGFGVVEHPPSPEEKKTQPWNCRYCQFQPTCVLTPTEEFEYTYVPGSKLERTKR